MSENDLDFAKWVIGILVAGYPFMAGLVVFLIRELIKSSKEGLKIYQEATTHNRQTNETLDKVNCVIEKVVELLK